MVAHQIERTGPVAANEVCSMELIADAWLDGGRFRALTVVHACTRVCLKAHRS
jgi:hypothetical protein